MRLLLNFVGVLLALVGIIWILQGIGLLPGSLMRASCSGRSMVPFALVAGCLALHLARRKISEKRQFDSGRGAQKAARRREDGEL